MIAPITVTWRRAAAIGMAAGLATLFAALLVLGLARLTDPTPQVRSAFLSGEIHADDAVAPVFTQMGRTRRDCEIAGVFVTADKKFMRFLFAPATPKDADRVLGVCQTVRDVALGGSAIVVDYKSAETNPVALRGVTRLALAAMPLLAWKAVLSVIIIAVAGGAAFLLRRRKDASPVALALLTVSAITALVFATTSLSIGFGAVLWPLAIAVALLTDLDKPWRLAVIPASLGALAILFDYQSGLVVSVMLSLLLALGVRSLSWRPIGVAAAAYLGAAVAVILVLGVAAVIVRGLGPLDSLVLIASRFTDFSGLFAVDGTNSLAGAFGRFARFLARDDGAVGLAVYAGVCLIGFGGWSLRLLGQRYVGRLILVSGLGLVVWILFMFDRVSSAPQQYISLPLLLMAYTLALQVAAVAPRAPAKLELVSS